MRTSLLVLTGALLTACGGAAGRTETTAVPMPEPEPAVTYTPGVVPDSFVVRLATTVGDIDLMLRRDWAPRGAERVYDLVSTGFFDGARFFRTLRGFVAQFGIAADPAVTAAWRGRALEDDPVLQSNRRGTLVFAAGAEPNTRTTQLFLNLRDNARLDALGFAPLGEVIAGHEVLSQLYTGYGDGAGGPQQGRMMREGEAYLAAEFPLLAAITTARVVRAWFTTTAP